MSNITEYKFGSQIYKTGFYQTGKGSKWWGRMTNDGKMELITELEFLQAKTIVEAERPKLDERSF
jgi:hypothetical protein